MSNKGPIVEQVVLRYEKLLNRDMDRDEAQHEFEAKVEKPKTFAKYLMTRKDANFLALLNDTLGWTNPMDVPPLTPAVKHVPMTGREANAEIEIVRAHLVEDIRKANHLLADYIALEADIAKGRKRLLSLLFHSAQRGTI